VRPNQHLRLELINTGVAAWAPCKYAAAYTVCVQAVNETNNTQDLDIAGCAPGQRVWIPWTATSSGLWRIRPLVNGLGFFGEPLEIEIVEEQN